MRDLRPSACVALILLASGWTGCSDDTTGPDPVVLSDLCLTVTVDESFTRWYSPTGFMFASGPEGEVLAVGEWTGPSTVVLANPDVALATVSFTVVVTGAVSLGYLDLHTQHAVAPRSEHLLAREDWPTPDSAAYLRCLDPPPHESCTVGANGVTMWSSVPLPAVQPVTFSGDVSDVFLRLNREQGVPLGGWVRGVEAGDSVTVDLSDQDVLQELGLRTVDLPAGASRLSWYVTVDHPAGDQPHSIYLDRHDDDDGEIPAVLAAYLPAEPATGFNVEIQAQFGEPSTHWQWIRTHGVVPTRFNLLTGEFAVVSDHPDSASYAWTGAADHQMAVWTAPGSAFLWWSLDGPVDGDLRLPQWPLALQAAFPEFSRDACQLSWLRLDVDVSPQITQHATWVLSETARGRLAEDLGKLRDRGVSRGNPAFLW